MKKYYVWHENGMPGTKIVEIGIERETEKYIWLMGGLRQSKMSWGDKYFDSWLEAHTYLLEQGRMRLENLREDYEQAAEKLKEIIDMKEPNNGKRNAL